MNYKISLSYNGRMFSGWSIQPNVRTVQGEFQKVIESLFHIQNYSLNASGRTDAFVHALDQTINLKHKDLNLSAEQLLNALKSQLPKDINVNSVSIVEDNFHARYHCLSKTYLYIINTKEKYDVINCETIYQYNQPLSINHLKEAANIFIGKHNFLSYSTSTLKDTIRTINWIDIQTSNGLIFIKINGDGFLRNMVRMIVANMINYSAGKCDLTHLEYLLEHPQKGSSQLKAPGCGLYLLEVNYEKS